MNIQSDGHLPHPASQGLHNLDPQSPAFLLRLLSLCHHAYQARNCVLLSKDKLQTHWTLVQRFPQAGEDLSADAAQLLKLAAQVDQTGAAITVDLADGLSLRVLPVNAQGGAGPAMMLGVWFWPEKLKSQIALNALDGLLPVALTRGQASGHRSTELRFDETRVLSLMADVLQEEKFRQMAHHLCNHLVADLGLERASIGVMKRRKIALQVVSQSAYFDPRSSLARDMEEAMEEACDQEATVQFPAPDDSRMITRMHEQFSSAHGHGTVLTVPIMTKNHVFGALFLEFGSRSLVAEDVAHLDRFCQALAPVLDRVYTSDLPWPKWVLKKARALAGFVLGPTYVAHKLATIAAIVGLAFITFFKIEHRVDAEANLRSENVSIIAAPFDGFLASVAVDLGQEVRQGDVLARLDERELLQEQTIAAADVTRYRREVEKARAAKEFAAMRIATAQMAQAEAQLNLVDYKLANATIRALRDGLVVDGDLKKELGAPVRQGDVLMQVAGTQDLYFDLVIAQADVHLVQPEYKGQVSLVGRPDTKIDFVIERIDPVARSNASGNQFLAKARYTSSRGSWWRPGMGGTAKIDTGPRSILWIMTHRTTNFLREFFWL